MNNTILFCALAAALSAPAAAAADKMPVSGPGFTAASEDRAMLDLLEGRAEAAAVTTELCDAVSGARELAWSERRKLLVLPVLKRHPLPSGKGAALVTRGDASPQVQALLGAAR